MIHSQVSQQVRQQLVADDTEIAVSTKPRKVSQFEIFEAKGLMRENGSRSTSTFSAMP